jgi:hypothetical protein
VAAAHVAQRIFIYSFILGLVTNAVLAEVFAVLVAFAAIQVVFDGSADRRGNTNLVLSGLGIATTATLACKRR